MAKSQRSYSTLLSEEAGLPVEILREALTLTGREPSAKDQVLSSAQRIWDSREPPFGCGESVLQTFQRSYSALCAEEAGVPIGIIQEVLAEEGRDESGRAKVMSAAQRIWNSRQSTSPPSCAATEDVTIEAVAPILQRSYSALCAEEAGVPIEIMKEVLNNAGRKVEIKQRVLSAAQRIWNSRATTHNLSPKSKRASRRRRTSLHDVDILSDALIAVEAVSAQGRFVEDEDQSKNDTMELGNKRASRRRRGSLPELNIQPDALVAVEVVSTQAILDDHSIAIDQEAVFEIRSGTGT